MQALEPLQLARAPSSTLGVVRDAFKAFSADGATRMAASLAFYTALSLAPLVMLVLWALGLLGVGAERHLIAQVEALIGTAAGDVIRAIIENANQDEGSRGVSGALGIGALMFSASGVFAELQSSLNAVWNVEARPGLGPLRWLRKRLLSLAMVGTLAFFLLVSLTASTAVAMLEPWVGEGIAWRAATLAATWVVFAGLFSVVFKLLPDVELRWGDVAPGAMVTAALFAVGKHAIGLYLARNGSGEAYGATGALIVLLVWVYYSAMIVFFGAELTYAWARARGRRFEPKPHAVAIADAGELQQLPSKA